MSFILNHSSVASWKRRNARRIQLLRKKVGSTPMSPAERAELRILQREARRRISEIRVRGLREVKGLLVTSAR
jgi:hypothetical protein